MKRDAHCSILAEVAEEQGMLLHWLSDEEANDYRRLAAARYGRERQLPITTECLTSCARLWAKDSWELIEQFTWNGEVILFTSPRTSLAMLRMKSLDEAIWLLAEAPPFDFMLMALDGSFLFGHDEYDNLFACGEAAQFVQKSFPDLLVHSSNTKA
jgi:hypothetical protein